MYRCVLCKKKIDQWKDRFFTVFTKGEVMGTPNKGSRLDFHKRCFVRRNREAS